jgi:hypothetical protein
MVDLAQLQAAYYMVAATGVLVAAAYYVMNIQTNKKNQELMLKTQQQTLETRQAQLFMQLFDRWAGSEFALQYGKACYEIYPKCNNNPEELNRFFYKSVNEQFNPDFFLTFHQLTLFFEGVGVLVRKDLVSIDLVERLFYDRIIWFWEMMKPRITFVRKSFGSKHLEDLEWLYDEMIQRRKETVL